MENISNRLFMFEFFYKVLNLIREFKKTEAFKNSFLITSSKIVSSLTNLAFMIYAVNLMTKAENGSFQYYFGFFPILLALAEFGLPSALVKYLAPVTEDGRRAGSLIVTSVVLKFYAFFVLICMGAAVIYFFNESYFIIFLLITGSFISSFISFFESIFVSYRNYIALSLWNPIPNLIRLLILFVASYSEGIGYIEILTIYCLSPMFVMGIFFLISQFSSNVYWTIDREYFDSDQKKLAIFNSWALIASIFAIVSDRLEIFFLNVYHGKASVAEYGTVLQLFSGFVILLSVLNSLIYPKLSRLVETKEFRNFLLKSVLIGGGMGAFLLPGIFLGEWIIGVLFKGNYAGAVPVFQILYPNFLLQLLFAPLGIALYAMGFPKFLAILACIRFFSGLILDNLLIPDFGTVGAAVSLFLGQIVSWLILAGYFSSILKSKDEL